MKLCDPLKLSHVFIYSSVFIACLSSHCPLLYDPEIYYHVLVKSLANEKKYFLHISCTMYRQVFDIVMLCIEEQILKSEQNLFEYITLFDLLLPQIILLLHHSGVIYVRQVDLGILSCSPWKFLQWNAHQSASNYLNTISQTLLGQALSKLTGCKDDFASKGAFFF